MEFRHLRYFLVLAEELHFGRAAQRLAISQPPLSMNLQQLEASVGARLLERNSKRVQLTPAGRAFVPQARALLEQAQRAARHAREVAEGTAGSLQVGFVGTMLYRGLPPLLQRFQAQHPGLRLTLRELSSSEQLMELAQDRLDLGFVHTTRVPPGLSQILVSSQPFVACLPVGHALAGRGGKGARRAALAPAQLRGEPFAMVSRAVSPDYHDRIVALCGEAGFTPDVRYELRHWLSVVSLVAQGLGVAMVPQSLARSGLPGAVFVPLDAPTGTYDTYCLWRDARESAALAQFLAVVRETPP
ncbi:MAG: LysR family transcriptional regulator [Betaproteobacteria bacterium HGW-Betaproteobacteria-3]|jgi:DNA-binding transcriptional LysR family regulator|nr:MAG: LysR family transcriptional regulator [Betaproteobacteria bacterium HGW-Betaproteobacteria-3]